MTGKTAPTTPLDHLHARMAAAGDDAGAEAARLAFFSALAATPLTVVLEIEPPVGADTLSPLVVETEDGPLVLGFDSDARMAELMGEVTPTATLSGADLALLLAPAGLGLAFNPEVAPSAMVLDAEALTWLAEAAADAAPEARAAAIAGLRAPDDAPEALVKGLARYLPGLSGQASRAWLAEARYRDGAQAWLLALDGVPEVLQDAVGAGILAALRQLGLGDLPVDLAYPPAGSPVARSLAEVALILDIPAAQAGPSEAPGSDPDRPPRLV